MFLNLCLYNETSGIFCTTNTYAEGGKQFEIGILFRVIEVFVKERVTVHPKLEENLSQFPKKGAFSNISFFVSKSKGTF